MNTVRWLLNRRKILRNKIELDNPEILEYFPEDYTDKEIEIKIKTLAKHLQTWAPGNTQTIHRDASFINIGLNELNNRTTKFASILALLVSILSVLLAGASLVAQIF